MNNKFKKNCSLLMLIFFFACMFNVNVLAANFTNYKIKYGDTLYKIAVKYKTSVSNLAKINNIKNPNRIYAGQTIKVPAKNSSINKGEINKKPNKPQNTVNKDNVKKIDILSLDALHGRLEKDENAIGIAKTSAYINHYRNNNLKGTLLLDAGNALQGTVLSTATHGKPVVDVYNTMKLDAMTVGNHEFDWGTKKLAETMKGAKFPLVSCNIYGNDGKRVPWAKPYVIINKNGVNVAIIGALNPKHKEAIAANVMKEVQFKDAITEVNALVPEVRKNGADVVLVLANIGGITDPKTKVCKGDLIDFSKALKNVDAVVGSLHNIVCTKINGMPVVEAFRYGEKLGHITLNYDINKKKVVNSSVEILDVKDGKLNLKQDTNVQSVVDKYAKDLKVYNDTIIGKTNKDLKRAKGENPIGNWSVDSMRESVNAQIAFTNPGGLRADINAGDITIGDVFKVMPFPNTIVTGKMTGKQVKEFLEQCAEVGIIPISGIKFEFDSSKEVGHRVVKATLSDGTDIKDDEVYKAATNSFLGGGKDGYTSLAKITWTDTKVLIRDAMLDNVKKNNGIKATVEGRSMNIKVVGYEPTAFFVYS